MRRFFSILRPGFGAFFVAAVFLTLFHEQNSFMGSAEVCRFLADGQRINHERRVGIVDDSTLSPLPWNWVNIRWACSLVVYMIYKWGGFASVILYFHAALAATLYILYRTLIRSGIGMFTVLVFMTILFTLFHHRFYLSSHIFSYLFLACLVGAFRARPHPDRLDWLFLPPMFFIWGNVDHGWVCGIMFLCISLFGRWIDIPSDDTKKPERVEAKSANPISSDPVENVPLVPEAIEPSKSETSDPAEPVSIADPVKEEPTEKPEKPQLRQIRLWFRLIIACVVCGCLNPILVLFPIFSMNTFFQELLRPIWNVHETPDFSVPSPAAIAILLTVIGFLASRFVPNRPLTTFEAGLPTFFFIELALKGQENAWLMLIVATVPLATDFDSLAKRFLGRFALFNCCEDLLAAWQSKVKGDCIWAIPLCVILGCIWLKQSAPHTTLHPGGDNFSSPAIAFLQAHADHLHRCLTSPETGAAVHWYLPGSKICLDERTESFNYPFFLEIAPSLALAANWARIVKLGEFDSAVITNNHSLNSGLLVLPGWKLAYSDEKVSVYFRDPPTETAPPPPPASATSVLPLKPTETPSSTPSPTPSPKLSKPFSKAKKSHVQS